MALWLTSKYRIACNFRGGKILVVFVVGGLTTNILPTNEATLPTVQAATTKILLRHFVFNIFVNIHGLALQQYYC